MIFYILINIVLADVNPCLDSGFDITTCQTSCLAHIYNPTDDVITVIWVCSVREKGKYNPSLKLAHDVAKALKSTIDELFIFEDE